MKIIVCHNFHQHAGGENCVIADEVSLLRSHGHDVVEFTKDNDEINGQGKLRLARGAIWNRRTTAEIRALVAAERAEIVHFHSTLPLISPAAYYAARSSGAAVVQTLHNYRLMCPKGVFFRDGSVCEKCVGRSIRWPSIKHGCYHGSRAASCVVAAMLTAHRAMGTFGRVVDRYIALSNFSRQKFIDGGLPAGKMSIKPTFVSLDPGTGMGDGGYAMFHGRLSPENGVDTLLEAWRELGNDIPLKLVGSGPLDEQAKAAATNSKSIEWLPDAGDEESRRVMSKAAFLVMPSLNYEGCPKTIVESFSNGTPVVASKLGAMAELVDDGRTGMHFRAGDAADLEEKVRSLLRRPERLTEMRGEARLEYEIKYTAETNYRRLIEIYKQALECRQARNRVVELNGIEESLAT